MISVEGLAEIITTIFLSNEANRVKQKHKNERQMASCSVQFTVFHLSTPDYVLIDTVNHFLWGILRGCTGY